MKHEKSCGIVVFKDNKVLLVHHNIGHWGMPKGHIEFGETDEETAKREVFEETGVEASIIEGFKEKITYSPKENVEKDVYFFVGEQLNDNITPQMCEVCEAKYVDIEEAYKLIKHEDEIKVIKKAIEFYKMKDENKV